MHTTMHTPQGTAMATHNHNERMCVFFMPPVVCVRQYIYIVSELTSQETGIGVSPCGGR